MRPSWGLRHPVGNLSSITVRMEYLRAFQYWYCELCVENRWGRKHCFVNFCSLAVLESLVDEGQWSEAVCYLGPAEIVSFFQPVFLTFKSNLIETQNTALIFSNNILLHHLISSHPQMFFKIGVLKNFANFRGKHLCSSLFLIQVVSCQISKIFKNNFFKEHLRWLLRYILYTHGVICNLSRWNNGCNGNYKKDQKKLKHFENIFEINFT